MSNDIEMALANAMAANEIQAKRIKVLEGIMKKVLPLGYKAKQVGGVACGFCIELVDLEDAVKLLYSGKETA